MSGKGSRPRPYSISQEEFSNNFDRIFRNKKEMTPSVEQMKKGTCGCGRSPTGDCIGWHALSEDMFRQMLAEWQAKEVDRLKQDK